MKRPLKPGESPFSSAKIVKRLSKLNLSKHSSKKTAKKQHFRYLNAPHNTTSFLINEFIKNKSPSDEECDIPQGSMKDLMNSSTDFYKSSFSSFDDITFLCLWYTCDAYLNYQRDLKQKLEENSYQNKDTVVIWRGKMNCDKKKGK